VVQALGADEWVAVLVAVTVLLAALLANLAEVRANARLQAAGSWALVSMTVVLLVSAATAGASSLSAVEPDVSDLGVLLPGVVPSFWAFAGFENLTLLSRDFRRPERDFLPVSAIALAVYGLLTILLTIAIAVRVLSRAKTPRWP
jgi:amino acid efflux transporter